MARGFGTTSGAASTDVVATTLTAHATLRSYSVFLYANSFASGNERIFDKRNAGSQVELWYSNLSGRLEYARSWSGGLAQFDIALPSTGAWHHYLLTYDAGAAANVPVIYANGSSVSVNGAGTSGTVDTNADAYHFGNRGGQDRNWNGMLAEVAIWDGILTVGEAKALYNGRSARYIRPDALVHYDPFIRANHNLVGSASTVTGTLVQAHPRTARLRPQIWRRNAAAAAGGFQAAWAMGSNVLIQPGRPHAT